jgi:hypothetical protein
MINFNFMYQGTDPGFQVGRGTLKKIVPGAPRPPGSTPVY